MLLENPRDFTRIQGSLVLIPTFINGRGIVFIDEIGHQQQRRTPVELPAKLHSHQQEKPKEMIIHRNTVAVLKSTDNQQQQQASIDMIDNVSIAETSMSVITITGQGMLKVIQRKVHLKNQSVLLLVEVLSVKYVLQVSILLKLPTQQNYANDQLVTQLNYTYLNLLSPKQMLSMVNIKYQHAQCLQKRTDLFVKCVSPQVCKLCDRYLPPSESKTPTNNSNSNNINSNNNNNPLTKANVQRFTLGKRQASETESEYINDYIQSYLEQNADAYIYMQDEISPQHQQQEFDIPSAQFSKRQKVQDSSLMNVTLGAFII
ncbi:UNKNOWN [Stylonychia lemnae]|uniref:Uncharacterized protein n=1 Tax=Stylonychia lemnae TaxID=5949 RepID=A0A078AID9_STYLE|nr:UNKNOWN [Stylonychia lemnae]|eukprot:CDW82010.1 UNKNOWN [Stylonychia lemnae]